jgi:transformation/transcription domain-associated protein
LEHFSQHLAEFEYQKFDEIEVPGQYLQLRDVPKNFVKIDRFEPTLDVVREYQGCHRFYKANIRSIVIRGNDGASYPFKAQHPAAKQCRREERLFQLFRFLNEY